MKRKGLAILMVLLLSFAFLPPLLSAQGTRADYERAAGLRGKLQGLALNLPERPSWIDKTSRFWHRKTVKAGFEFDVVDAATGKTRAIVNEESKTFFCYYSNKYRFDVQDGKEIIWASERDGWNHLYLCDGATGTVKNQITKGSWRVRGVDKVNEAARQVWFRAGGMKPGQDPYFIHYCRINFDGSGLTVFTEGDGSHLVSFSPDMAEKDFILAKLEQNNWNISQTARRIDTPRSNLYKKLEQFGIKITAGVGEAVAPSTSEEE